MPSLDAVGSGQKLSFMPKARVELVPWVPSPRTVAKGVQDQSAAPAIAMQTFRMCLVLSIKQKALFGKSCWNASNTCKRGPDTSRTTNTENTFAKSPEVLKSSGTQNRGLVHNRVRVVHQIDSLSSEIDILWCGNAARTFAICIVTCEACFCCLQFRILTFLQGYAPLLWAFTITSQLYFLTSDSLVIASHPFHDKIR